MRLPWRKHKIPCQILWIFRYYAEFIEWCYRPLSQLESREMMKTKLVCTVDDPPEYLLLFNFCHNCIFDLYIQVPLRTPMLLRETWIFPKWQDQTFVVNTFILKPLHFPTIIRRVFGLGYYPPLFFKQNSEYIFLFFPIGWWVTIILSLLKISLWLTTIAMLHPPLFFKQNYSSSIKEL